MGACAVTWLARQPLTLAAELPGDVWKTVAVEGKVNLITGVYYLVRTLGGWVWGHIQNVGRR